jgi:hypothetical protein
MPQRLRAQAEVRAGEKTIYDDYYARLSAWLAVAGRATLAGVIPSPDAILALAPRWVQSMTMFANTTIAEMVGRAYLKVFGPGYRYDNRPFVVDYLARVVNRLVEVPEQAYSLVVGQIAEGALAGESIGRIADRVRQTFDVTATAYWRSRPTTVARSEVVGALNSGRLGAFREVSFDLGEPFEKFWLATTVGAAAERTRDSHREADGQRVPLNRPFIVGGFPGMFPGAPELPARESIQCLPGETLVSFPGLRGAMRRWYEGDLVKIGFASGDELSITPNHPVLRADGVWTPAGLLREGDHCIRAFGDGNALGAPHEHGGPSQIGEIYRLAEMALDTHRVAVAPPDFHGDGAGGHVDVVPVNRGLRVDGSAASDEEVEQFGLALADILRPGLGNCQDSPRTAASRFRPDGRSGLLPHSRGEFVASFGTQVFHALVHGRTATTDGGAHFAQSHDNGCAGEAECAGERQDALASFVPRTEVIHGRGEPPEGSGVFSTASRDPNGAEPVLDGLYGDAECFCDGRSSLASFVTTSEIVKIDVYAFSGHVYNLDTGEGWYIANSILCRNCRCTMLIMRPGEETDLSNRQFTDL